MKTRVKDLSSAAYSFQYGEGKRPNTWHHVGGNASPASWPTADRRDRARACFTHRRSVQAALADLKRLGLAT